MLTSRAYATHADEAPAYWMIGVLWRVLATGVQTDNAFCLLDQLCSGGSGPARHAHAQDEGLYVVSGRCTFNAGGQEFQVSAGSLVMVPRHTEHCFVVDEEAVLINFYMPAGFELFIIGAAVPAQSADLPPPGTPSPPHRLVDRLSEDYGGAPHTRERTTRANPDGAARPGVASARTAEAFWFEGARWSILADAAATGGRYCAFEMETTTGLVRPPWQRRSVDEAFYVLDGEAEFLLQDRVVQARRGAMVFVPRGAVAACRIVGATARLLNIQTAPGYERLVRCLGTPAAESGPPSPGHGRRDETSERVRALRAEVGVQPVIVPSRFQVAADG